MSKVFITFDSFPHCFIFPMIYEDFFRVNPRKGAVPKFQENNPCFWKTITKGSVQNHKICNICFLQNKQPKEVKLYCLWTYYRFTYVSNYLDPISAV